MNAKRRLRKQLSSWRIQLPDAAYQARSSSLVSMLQADPIFEHAKVVHLYWPIIDRHEPDLRPFVFWLMAHNIEVVMPIIDDIGRDDLNTPRLRHARFSSPAQLKPNRWGILEPYPVEEVPVDALDAVIVPALAVDRYGNRLGFGKGFYDVFLSEICVPTICPVFDHCLLNAVPNEKHDVRISVIVTEYERIECPFELS